MSRFSTIFFTASLASLALAKTDLSGCTSTDVSSPAGASIAWYVPGTGELCEFLDCGGGRAPPKTTVPGCPLYSGTATYSPSYLAGYGQATASATSAAETTSSAEAAMSTSYAAASSSSSSGVDVVTTESTTGAWSETSETNTSLDNSAVGVTSYETASSSASSVSSGMSTITSSSNPGAVGGSSSGNGTSTGSGSSGSGSGSNTNGTVSSGTPSPITSNSGAMETARVWLGGSALIGLGAIVAAL